MKRQSSFALRLMVSALCLAAWRAGGAQAQMGTCAGDCNHDDRVTVDELVPGSIWRSARCRSTRCPDLDPGGDGEVTSRRARSRR